MRSGNCSLQTIANDLNILDLPFEKKVPETRWDRSFPLFRDAAKCIKCMRCIQICDKVQTLNIWMWPPPVPVPRLDVSLNRKIAQADCSLCGQCITHCPVGRSAGAG